MRQALVSRAFGQMLGAVNPKEIAPAWLIFFRRSGRPAKKSNRLRESAANNFFLRAQRAVNLESALAGMAESRQ
jgi:hypothetical protein